MDLTQWKGMKAIIFDLDGVLVDSRHLHFLSFNKALEEIDTKYVLSVEEHLAKYDGRPTKDKLHIVTQEKGLPISLHHTVWKRKQEVTNDLIKDIIKPNPQQQLLLNTLKTEGYKLYCCSNSIRSTLISMLESLEILHLFDNVYSNEDVVHPKPHPNIYMKCFAENILVPQQTMIIEDSPIGRVAAQLSGAHVCPVADPVQVTYEHIKKYLEKCQRVNASMTIDTRWNSRVQVVIPMAGAGSRFAVKGFTSPKPLIDIDGKPMIQWVIDNLNLKDAIYIFIVRKIHLQDPRWQLRSMLEKHAPGCIIIETENLTNGPACSVLLAREYLDHSLPLLVANSDQFLEWDANAFLYESQNVDGSISIFEQPDPNDKKWSYVKVDENGLVTDVREKEPISTHASTGVYYWKRSGDFIKYADQMIAKDIRVNNEFYVCPVYNEAIHDGKKIKIHRCKKMWGLGVPEDLENFLHNYLHLVD